MNGFSDWELKWNHFLASGGFDSIPHPENGYFLGEPVCTRDRGFYLFKGVRSVSQAILALSREDDTLEKVVALNDIRPNGDVLHLFTSMRFIEFPEDNLIEFEPPLDPANGKSSSN